MGSEYAFFTQEQDFPSDYYIVTMFSEASETQNCRYSITAPGRQEIGYGSLTGRVKVDCPEVFLPSVTSGYSVFS